MSDNTALATSWLDGLAARGITTRLVNGRIRHFPASAYKQFTDAEIIFLRRHRAEIRDALEASGAAGLPVQVAPLLLAERCAPTFEPAPKHCPFCMRSPCVGRENPAFGTFHASDPFEFWRRRAEQREKDAWEFEMRRRYGLLSPTWE